jgi:hypothetical protein
VSRGGGCTHRAGGRAGGAGRRPAARRGGASAARGCPAWGRRGETKESAAAGGGRAAGEGQLPGRGRPRPAAHSLLRGLRRGAAIAVAEPALDRGADGHPGGHRAANAHPAAGRHPDQEKNFIIAGSASAASTITMTPVSRVAKSWPAPIKVNPIV